MFMRAHGESSQIHEGGCHPALYKPAVATAAITKPMRKPTKLLSRPNQGANAFRLTASANFVL
jgi:hypothetical protein